MADISLPALNLFNKNPSLNKKASNYHPNRDNSYKLDALKDSNRIPNPAYIPQYISPPPLCNLDYMPIKGPKLDNLSPYYDPIYR
jgi:hypothetical protein